MMRKNKILFLALNICLLFSTVPCFASSNGVYVTVNYSGNIIPDKNDRFALTYRYLGGDDTATIEVNAYDLNGTQGMIDIGEGQYEISNIEYLGSNIDMESNGYGCTNEFNVESEGSSYIKIAMGKVAADELKQSSEKVILRQNGILVDEIQAEQTSIFEDTNTTEIQTVEDTAIKNTEKAEKMTPETEKVKQTGQESVISIIIKRLLPLLVILIILFLYLIKLLKKNGTVIVRK